jgi:sporulation protein YlmC with PRC-barrel domain
MSQDSGEKIGKLKNIAIDRCRERIEQAAFKAKELMNNQNLKDRKRELQITLSLPALLHF